MQDMNAIRLRLISNVSTLDAFNTLYVFNPLREMVMKVDG